VDGSVLREWRRSRGWDAPDMARRLRFAADGGAVPEPDSLKRMIWRWEREGLRNERYELLYARALGVSPDDLPVGPAKPGVSALPPAEDRSASQVQAELALDEGADHAIRFSQRASTSTVGEATVERLDEQVRALARDYLTAPPLPLVQEAALISRSVYGLLDQRQRLRDARELLVIAAKSHAFLAWAAGDLGRLPSAVAHGRAALTLAEEAGHPGAAALALSALSKTAFWGSQARAARVYAQRGFEHGPVNTTRALLACQIADASSDREALAAIASASDALESAAVDDDLGGVFECGRIRVINYAIGVHLKAGDAKGALTASSSARNLRPGEQSIGYGTLAQIAIGSGFARLLQRDLPGAASEIAPVLTLPPERRLATMAGKLTELAVACETAAMSGGGEQAAELAGRIRDYCQQTAASALPGKE
jgi:transcriptional regulator with XRE-family HTH domain